MIVAGAGMVVGNIMGGYFSDKKDPVKVIITILFLMIIFLVFVFLFSENKIISIILTFICGVLSMSMGTPISMIMLKNAKHSEMLGAAFVQASFNVANSIGAFVGGIPLIFGLSFNYPSLVGAGIATLGLILTISFYKRNLYTIK